jgi:hypothetical protein
MGSGAVAAVSSGMKPPFRRITAAYEPVNLRYRSLTQVEDKTHRDMNEKGGLEFFSCNRYLIKQHIRK